MKVSLLGKKYRHSSRRLQPWWCKMCLLLLLLCYIDRVAGQTVQENMWVTNGVVQTIARSNNTVYLGGSFSYVGPKNAYGAAISITTGIPDANNLKINGKILCSVADGSGGWYIGGEFTKVGDQNRNRIARVNADGTVNAWNATANNSVYALAISGATVYAGGFFTNIGGQARSYIAALNNTTGAATTWNPGANSYIYAISISGTTLYAGGAFTTIAATTRNYLAAFNITTGAIITTWNPGANNTVQALVASATVVYAGGYFTNAGGSTRNYVAALNTSSGAATTWNPGAGSTVWALAVSGSTIYIGGGFITIGGQSRTGLAAVNTTGTVTTWNPNGNGTVYTVSVSGSTIYAGGAFTTLGGQTRNYLGAVDATSGLATSWYPNTSGVVRSISNTSTVAFVGGDFLSIGGLTRNNLAALNATTGAATSWNPNASNAVTTLVVNGSVVFVGGSFSTIGGASRTRIAAIDTATGAPTTWNPGGNGYVNALAVSGNNLYVGGNFSSFGGQSRSNLAAVDVSTGIMTSWNPNANSTVYALAASGSTVYAGGAFTTIGSQTRYSIAAIDATGTATSWNPNTTGEIYALAASTNTVYAGGNFTNIGGQNKNHLAAIDAATGNATSWNPDVSGLSNTRVFALSLSGNIIYAGGSFTNIGGQNRYSIAAVTTTTGAATYWNPNPNPTDLSSYSSGIVRAIANSSNQVYLGGNFNMIKIADRPFVAALTADTTNTCTNIPFITSGDPAPTAANFFDTYSFTTVGGTAPYTYTLQSGYLPAGISLGSNGTLVSNGSISYSLTGRVKVTDAIGCSTTRLYTGLPVYRSTASGTYTNAAIWQVLDTTGFVAATTAPPNTAIVNITAGHTVTLGSNAGAKMLNIDGTFADAGNTYSLAGHLSGTGTHSGDGKIVMSGNNDYSYLTSASNGTLNIKNLQLDDADNFMVMNGTVRMNGKLTLTSGTLYVGYNFIFASDAVNNGRLGQVGAGNIAGSLTLERYIPAKRAWRMMTTPLSNTGSIYQRWQNNGVVIPGTGVEIWKPGGGNGFTAGGSNTSMQRFDESIGNWVNLSSTNTNLSGTGSSAANNAYSIFVTGAHGNGGANIFVPATATTLTAIGQVQTGDQTFTFGSHPAGGYALVGNPYISAVNFAGMTRNNVSNKFWAWDPQRSGTSYGGYVTVSWDSAAGVYDIDFPASATAQKQYIHNGQAIFVELTTAATATVTFHEADKVDTFTNAVFKTTNGNAATIRTTLNRSIGGTMTAVDANYAKFADGYHTTVTDDAAKFYNYDENISLLRNGELMSIERRPAVTQYDTLYYNLYAMKQNAVYSLQLSPEQWSNTSHEAWLVDTYLDSTYAVDLASSTNEYGFSTQSGVPLSYGANRFYLVFHALTVTPLSAGGINLTARKVNSTVAVNWDAKNEQGLKHYELEKSTDGKSFSYLVRHAAKNIAVAGYSAIDVNPVHGANYYRVKTVSTGGGYSYSKTVKLVFDDHSYEVNVFPNPVKDGVINMHYDGMPQGNYMLTMYDAAGRAVYSRPMHIGGSGIAEIKPSVALSAGAYQLSIASEQEVYTTISVMVQ